MSPQFNDQTKRIDEIKRQEEEALAMALSEKLELPYTDLSIVPVNIEALDIVPEQEAREAQMAIFAENGKNLDVAILTPNNKHLKNVLEKLKQKEYKVNLHVSSMHSLESAWARYKEITRTEEVSGGMIELNEKEIKEIEQKIPSLEVLKKFVKDELEGNKNKSATKVLEIIVAGSLAVDASDIHIEPEEEVVRLRLRLDGVLQDIFKFDQMIYRHILSRIKLISGLKLNVKKLAQDGRFTIKTGEEDIEIRTSILPGNYGESIVLRILDPNTVALDIERLGMSEKVLSIMKNEITKPNGMILNTGPTGSGKTTTLYSFLRQVNKPDVKIITIEDPIEYHLKGIIQTQVRKGYGFLEGLRSALRQDPDVMMVGEVRDTETARIAINSALTGHLVFSTLHTNNAAGAIPRLLDLGVDIKVVGDAVNILMAQRLIRVLCTTCKEEYSPDEKEKKLLQIVIEGMPEEYKKTIPDLNTLKLFHSKGCEDCNNTGYKGRLGIFEIIQIDSEIAKVILTHPNEHEIWQAAKPQGIPRMKEDGVLKIIDGLTDFAEVQRVVDLLEE